MSNTATGVKCGASGSRQPADARTGQAAFDRTIAFTRMKAGRATVEPGADAVVTSLTSSSGMETSELSGTERRCRAGSRLVIGETMRSQNRRDVVAGFEANGGCVVRVDGGDGDRAAFAGVLGGRMSANRAEATMVEGAPA